MSRVQVQSPEFKPSSGHAGMAELLQARVGHDNGGRYKVSGPTTACESSLHGCSRGYVCPCLDMEPVWRAWMAATSFPNHGVQPPSLRAASLPCPEGQALCHLPLPATDNAEVAHEGCDAVAGRHAGT